MKGENTASGDEDEEEGGSKGFMHDDSYDDGYVLTFAAIDYNNSRLSEGD